MITKFLKRLIVSTPVGKELDDFLPYGVIVYTYEKDGIQKKGIVKKELISKVQNRPGFSIIKECLNTEVGHNYSYNRMAVATINAPKPSKKFHSEGGKSSGKNGKASIRIKKVYEKYPLEMRKVNFQNGKRIAEWNKNPENKEVKSQSIKKAWAEDDGTMRNAANKNLSKARPLESPKYWEWISSKNEKRIEACRKAAKIGASLPGAKEKFIENRDPAAGGRVGGKTTQSIVRVCPHCEKPCKGSSYFTWHGEKCKKKPA